MNINNLFSLNGRLAIVTGGLGQVGRVFVKALVDYGAAVAIIDLVARNSEALKLNGDTHFYECDITDRQRLEETSKEIVTHFGRIPDVLVNNAAIDSPPDAPTFENGPFETYPENSLDRIFDVNVKGMIFCCQVFGGLMAKNGSGSIINISSVYGLVSPNQDIYEYKRKKGDEWYKPVAYATSKSAIVNLTRYLAVYWAKKGVRVNTLVPAGVANNQPDEFLEEYHKRIPIGRMAEVNELIGPLIFLSSDASSYMTGSLLVVDGGYTAW